MLVFNKKYFAWTILIFLIEVMIALFVNDNFVRPYLGDVLVVMLIYCFLKTFLKLPVLPVAMFVLLFSFTIEFLQYINIIRLLSLEKSAVARTVMGTSFAWFDVLAYIAGTTIVLAVENYYQNVSIRNQIRKGVRRVGISHKIDSAKK
jgi:hypothetical protein